MENRQHKGLRTPTSVSQDSEHLARAVALAARGPRVDPNPRVGAVIVDAAGAVAGEGWHQGAGTPHAERAALAAAGKRARGGTAYVSLEPCRHTGRTGPCTQALLAAGVARVVFAQSDPGPEAGGGAAELRAAGVAVVGPATSADLARRAAALNEPWSFAMMHGRPRVVWKTATTLDGRSAAADGTSQWITGPTARAAVHRLRAECGAIIVGTGTAVADDPRLTVRGPDGAAAERQPLRVVVGERDLPPRSVLATEPGVLHLRHRNPRAALATLHELGIRQVLLEGGPTVAAAYLRAGLVDRVVAHVAPLLLGAGPTLADFGVSTLAAARRLVIRDVEQLGPDLSITADVLAATTTATTSTTAASPTAPREGDTCSPA